MIHLIYDCVVLNIMQVYFVLWKELLQAGILELDTLFSLLSTLGDANREVCRCGDSHGYAVVCDEEKLVSAVLDCHCVTYDEQTGSTYLGSCFYNCNYYNTNTRVDQVYFNLPKLPESLNKMNDSSCTRFYRTGLLCGDCKDGHSPLVFSYNLTCVKCPDGHKNWWNFILVAFVPLTFFYFNLCYSSCVQHQCDIFSSSWSCVA